MALPLAWIEEGRQFGFDDMVFWQGRGHEPFAQAAARVDTVVLGPHASAAFPGELRPFVSPVLTRRKQFDYSDVITSALGRAWALADPHVVFVENPHSRLVLDGNREASEDVGPGLREFFARLARQRQGEKLGFGGVDAVRPITFAGEPVLVEPGTPAEWDALLAALARAGTLGARAYFATRQQVLAQLLQSRAPERPLHVISLHDTMNTTVRADGAIVVERPEADRLPPWVNFGNRGDAQGEPGADGKVTLAGTELRRLCQTWTDALTVHLGHSPTPACSLNAPYKGAFETVWAGALLRASAPVPRVGAVQVEFLREALLGPAVTAHLHQPGEDWPAVDEQHLSRVVAALCDAGQRLRSA